jgi:hypothetical protein
VLDVIVCVYDQAGNAHIEWQEEWRGGHCQHQHRSARTFCSLILCEWDCGRMLHCCLEEVHLPIVHEAHYLYNHNALQIPPCDRETIADEAAILDTLRTGQAEVCVCVCVCACISVCPSLTHT